MAMMMMLEGANLKPQGFSLHKSHNRASSLKIRPPSKLTMSYLFLIVDDEGSIFTRVENFSFSRGG